jgi:hypothetical protein
MRGGERLNGGETCRQYTIGHRVVHAGKVDRPVSKTRTSRNHSYVGDAMVHFGVQ